MTTSMKTGLLAGASAIAFGYLAMASAYAFDQVNWRWDATVTEQVNKTVNVNINLEPTGMVMLEDLQIQVGDVTATSEVHDIYNNAPGGGTPPTSLAVQWHYGLGGVLLNDGFNSPEVSTANVDETDHPPNINGTVTATIDLSTLVSAPIDAVTQLPRVVSAATAVGNNVSITTDVPVQLHEGQFTFGGISGDSVASSDGVATGGINTNLLLAGLGLLELANGNLVKANISATSDVYNILNASVDSTATAVANNLSVNVAPSSPDNALLIGDATQFSYADVSAASRVHDVTLNNYVNLGSPLGRPIVSSIATAVGNNKSITVLTPVVAAP
jgi:hypothetical protein